MGPKPKSAAPKKRNSSSGWKALPAEDIKRFKSFVNADKNRKHPNPHTDALVEAYNSSDREGKRDILQRWAGDKTLAWVTGFVREKAFVTAEGSEVRRTWLTEAAICMAEGLGQLEKISPENRKVLDEILLGYDSRPHELPNLAALGLKQFRTKRVEEVESSLEKDAVTMTVSASGIDSKSSRKAVKTAGGSPATASKGAPDGLAINYEVACKAIVRDVEKVLQKIRLLLANATKAQAHVADADNRAALRQGLRVLQDATDQAADSVEAVEYSEEGLDGLKQLIQRVTLSHQAFVDLLEECCPRALPKAKAKAKAREEAGDEKDTGNEKAAEEAPKAAAEARK